jgi:hypothetical protein
MSTLSSVETPVSQLAPVDQLYLLKPKNRAFVEGRSRRLANRSQLFGLIFTAGLLVFMLIMAIGSAKTYLDGTKMTTNPVTQAAIVDRWTSSTAKSTTYYVSYQYSVPGIDKVFQNQVRVSAAMSRQLNPNSTIDVHYNPENPQISQIAGDEALIFLRQDTLIPIAVCSVSVVLIAIFLVVLSKQELKERRRLGRLAAQGKLIPGKLLSAKTRVLSAGTRQLLSHNKREIIVSYSYLSPKGEEKTRQARWQRRSLKEPVLPTPGTPLAVLYVNEKLIELM